jgi:hypothetical protein
MTTARLGAARVLPLIAIAARELVNKSKSQRCGVLSTAMSLLGLSRNPIVTRITRRGDWRIADLRPEELIAIRSLIAGGDDPRPAAAIDAIAAIFKSVRILRHRPALLLPKPAASAGRPRQG